MKINKKNPVLAITQRHGNNNRFILQILACLQENCKYIFFTILVSIISIYISEMIGKFIAYLIWR